MGHLKGRNRQYVVSKHEGVTPVETSYKDDVQCHIFRRCEHCCIMCLRMLCNSFKYVDINKGPRRRKSPVGIRVLDWLTTLSTIYWPWIPYSNKQYSWMYGAEEGDVIVIHSPNLTVTIRFFFFKESDGWWLHQEISRLSCDPRIRFHFH